MLPQKIILKNFVAVHIEDFVILSCRKWRTDRQTDGRRTDASTIVCCRA